MDKIVLNIQKRTATGKKVRILRKQGILPANIFGKNIKSQAISISAKEFTEVFKKAGETSLLTLVESEAKEKKEHPVLISNIQNNPLTDLPIHVDFHQVDLKEKVTAKVPVELTGESPAEKQSLGTVVTYISEIEVEALPTNLPEKFVVDISELSEVDQQVLVKDLKYNKKTIEVKIDLESIVVKVEPPQKEEVIVPAPAAVEAVGPEGAVKSEGEAPAEGAKEEKKEEAPKEEKKE